jgi:hypothetical protein
LDKYSSLNTAIRVMGAAGTQTAALSFGGDDPSVTTGQTEEWNGASWSISPASLNTARFEVTGTGLQTAALAVGGEATSFYRCYRRI